MHTVRPFTDSEKRYLQRMKLWRPELEQVGREEPSEEDSSSFPTLREDACIVALTKSR